MSTPLQSSQSNPLDVIRGACPLLELAARAERGVTDADLAAQRPAGDAAEDWSAWWRYHTWLSRTLAQGQSAQRPAAHAPAGAADLDDAILLDAYRSQPRVVRLAPAGDLDGPRPTVTVYPKSAHALLELRARDLLLAQYADAIATLQAATDPDAIEVVQRAHRELDYQHLCAAWTLTHPGPGLPYERHDDATDAVIRDEHPTPPREIVDLSPFELLAISRAGRAVNQLRLEALEALTAADPTDGTPPGTPRRPSWSAFFASLAADPADMQRLMRDVDLPNLLAAVRLKADVQLAAHQDAERAAEARRAAA